MKAYVPTSSVFRFLFCWILWAFMVWGLGLGLLAVSTLLNQIDELAIQIIFVVVALVIGVAMWLNNVTAFELYDRWCGR